MHPHAVIRAMEGGLLGTLLQTMVVYGMAPFMTGRPMDLTPMLEPACAMGLLARVCSGAVLFPLAYVSLPSRGFPEAPVLKGMLWAGLLWSVTEFIIAPMLGAGVFSAALGGLPAAARALLGYLVYGATLGSIVGLATPESRRVSHAL